MSLFYEIIPLLILDAHIHHIHSQGCGCSFHCLLSHSFSRTNTGHCTFCNLIFRILSPSPLGLSQSLRLYCVISSGFGYFVHCMCNRCCFWFGNVKYRATQRLLLGSKLFFFCSMKCDVMQGIFLMWRSMQGRYLIESAAKFRRWLLGIEWTVHRQAKKT
jgi:hypothetical protein